MADKKISELTELTTPDGTEELVVNDSGVSKKISIDNIFNQTITVNGSVTCDSLTVEGASRISAVTGNGLNLATNSTDRLHITSGGSVGIGTSSPSQKLDVAGSITATAATAKSIVNTTADAAANPELQLTAVARQFNLGTGGATFGTADIRGAFYIYDNTSSAYRMVIDSSGNVLIGKTALDLATSGHELRANGLALHTVSNNDVMILNRLTSEGTILVIAQDGVIRGSISISGSATSYNTSSDYRLKENVVPMTGSIDRLKALNPSRFNFIADADKTVDGFLAHEAGEVVPECATGTKDAMKTEEYEVTPEVKESVTIPAVKAVKAVLDDEGNITTEAVQAQDERTEEQVITEAVMGEREVPDYQGIDQSKLVPLLVASLQEAIARIEQLEAKL